jgi:hypothetical protein
MSVWKKLKEKFSLSQADEIFDLPHDDRNADESERVSESKEKQSTSGSKNPND